MDSPLDRWGRTGVFLFCSMPTATARSGLHRSCFSAPPQHDGIETSGSCWPRWSTKPDSWPAADSIAGHDGIDASTAPPPDPESIRDAKGWLSRQLPPGQPYRPTLHQGALTAIFDLDAARAATSFDKLWRDLTPLLIPEQR